MFLTPKFTPANQAKRQAANSVNHLVATMTSQQRLSADSKARRGTQRWVTSASAMTAPVKVKRPAKVAPEVAIVVTQLPKRVFLVFTSVYVAEVSYAYRFDMEFISNLLAEESSYSTTELPESDEDELGESGVFDEIDSAKALGIVAWGTDLDYGSEDDFTWRGFHTTTRP